MINDRRKGLQVKVILFRWKIYLNSPRYLYLLFEGRVNIGFLCREKSESDRRFYYHIEFPQSVHMLNRILFEFLKPSRNRRQWRNRKVFSFLLEKNFFLKVGPKGMLAKSNCDIYELDLCSLCAEDKTLIEKGVRGSRLLKARGARGHRDLKGETSKWSPEKPLSDSSVQEEEWSFGWPWLMMAASSCMTSIPGGSSAFGFCLQWVLPRPIKEVKSELFTQGSSINNSRR